MSENIENSAEEIGLESEQISEIMPEQIRYRGQRGTDKTPRRFNPNSLRNLKQFQYIPVAKSNFDRLIWIVIGILVAVLIGIILWRIYDWRKKRNNLKNS